MGSAEEWLTRVAGAIFGQGMDSVHLIQSGTRP